MKELLVLSAMFVLLYGYPAFADYANGTDAYQKGEYKTALKEWQLLADSVEKL